MHSSSVIRAALCNTRSMYLRYRKVKSHHTFVSSGLLFNFPQDKCKQMYSLGMPNISALWKWSSALLNLFLLFAMMLSSGLLLLYRSQGVMDFPSNHNHRMAWVGRNLEEHQAPTPLLQAGPPTSLSNTRSGCPGPHPTLPWTPPGMGHPQPLSAMFHPIAMLVSYARSHLSFQLTSLSCQFEVQKCHFTCNNEYCGSWEGRR